MDKPHESSPETPIVSDWAEMEAWLVESLGSMTPVGVLDLGPAHVHDDEVDADCVQIHALTAGTFLIRLSTTMMSTPLIGRHRVPREILDTWFYDDRFTDCTHGYLISRSPHRVAEITVAWFRDRCGYAGPEALGCSYTEPIDLPRIAADRVPRKSQGYP
ncbi:hypothetical protein AAFP30_00965 [Gordonia sp. CPCC 205515]|uniref:hypothetical protein n=1 Tax=Gordonia sp. CPCC 205515 TaxID=3140791 RepID=UPI003AF3C40D